MRNENKHTPGPRASRYEVYIQSRASGNKRWETHIPPVTPGFMVSAEERAEVTAQQWREENPGREYRVIPSEARRSALARAKEIASAPDGYYPSGWVKRARAAIARAKGE